jgi:tripartite ATP-independent transporter DctP family solute receptor
MRQYLKWLDRFRSRLGVLSAVAVVSLGAGACGGDDEQEGGAAGDEPLEFVMAVETAQGDTLSNYLTYLADEIEAELGDRVKIDRFYAGAKGDEAAILESVRAGAVDMVPVGSDIVTLDPMFGILEMPFLFRTRDEVAAVLDGELGAEMSASLEESQGLHVVGYGENGFRHITNSKRPIVTPDDLKGLKLRIPDVEARATTFETLGATPTALSFDEIYLALDQGVVDGQENPLQIISQYSFDEVQKYLSLSNHVYTPATMVINAERWNSLPDDVKQAFEAAAVRATEKSRQDGIKADEELAAELEGKGMEVNEVDVDVFRERVQPVWDSLKSEVGAEFVDKVLAELQQ